MKVMAIIMSVHVRKPNLVKENHEGGFSLLEMLIAVLLFTIVTGAIYGLLEVSRADRLTTNQRVDAMQSLRVAINAIGRDALNSGFGFPNTGAIVPAGRITTGAPLWMPANNDRLTAIMGADNVNGTTDPLTHICDTGTAVVADTRLPCTDQVSFVYRDNQFSEAIARNKRINQAFPVLAFTSPFTKLFFSPDDSSFRFTRVSTPPDQSTKYYLDGSLKADDIAADGSYVQVNRYGGDGVSGGTDDLTHTANTILNSHVPQQEVAHTNDIFVIVGGKTSAVGVVTGFDDGTGPDSATAASRIKMLFGDDSTGLGLNAPANGNPISAVGPEGASAAGSAAYKITWVTYRVVRDDPTILNPPTGTLMRVKFGYNGPGKLIIEETPVAYNVSGFQVRYVKSDGTVVDSTTGVDSWTIAQVFVTITAHSPINERRSNAPFNVTLSSTFNTRNVGYDVR